ncbi:MAG: hypothetical protein ACE5IQ_06720 [Candidatus Methylomirabilales bacterium]
MPEIDQALIDETWRRIRGYDAATAVAEAQRFAREQPAVLGFTREFLREFDEGTRGTALGFAYLLFQATETARGAPLPSLPPEQIEERSAINTEWLDDLERVESAPLQCWQDRLPTSPVALHIVRAYAPRREHEEGSERRRRAHLLVFLITLLDAWAGTQGNSPSL